MSLKRAESQGRSEMMNQGDAPRVDVGFLLEGAPELPHDIVPVPH